ncbi:MAG: pilus assembly protein [Candidatus Omnitrophica bacterium]|nr:pilus assembly protein [Candidatus Omnitrophota bacterium]
MSGAKGQSIIEFCFACAVFMLLLFGMVQTVRWIMMDLAERRYDHEAVLTAAGPLDGQLNPNFHRPRPLDAALFKKGK